MVAEKFKKNIEDMTALIESCWDENNPNDGLSFDERLEMKLNENPELKKFSDEHNICD
ncbi:hypothetical protein [Methanobrevibacter boviskoreani]|uniref:hypothetical protein n=1 Tax=Methanobrevibacter boviskoreani TaxID=1348249 RepID=UPI0023F04B5D|nr:hypothetical protein [Methanobrevibacter boviskoreani]MDD6256513.1 hypothetical protein [Methanobrevibacter boviskoreani]